MLAGVKRMANKQAFIFQVLCFYLVVISINAQAIESSIQLHKVDQDKSFGYSLSIGDEFFKQKTFNWQVSYNRLENVAIADLDETSDTWDKAGFDFSVQTVELSLGYRYYPRSYDKFISSLMFEVQAGAAVNLTEHKLIFRPDFDRDDIYYAEQGDINPVLSITMQKSFTKNSAIHFGLKHYPSYSEFGSISTIFIGFNYRFGRQLAY